MTAVGYQHYLDVASSRDVPTFRRRLDEFAQRLDFPLFNATLVVERPASRPTIIDLRNAPGAFEESSRNDDDARRDPVSQRIRTATSPVLYDQSLYVNHAAGDLWEEQAPHGYSSGISMPMHLSNGRHFIFGVDRPDPLPADPDKLIRLVADLQLLAVYAQETALRLLMPQTSAGEESPKLSPREQEVLKWTMAGKSNQIIGQLMNISLSTVNFHLRTAMSKLGVASKHQAAAKAHAQGLI
jgi:DNA-binding CsgD family transcriptional regulator